jgi:Outer membrane protein beta-barrel domain
MDRVNRKTMRLLDRVVIGLLVLLAMLLAGLQAARAAEIVPSVGLTHATAGDGGYKTFAGLALRGSVLPMGKAELGVGYRKDSYLNGDLDVRMWPVTGSLWLTPLPMFYFGGGAGVYQTTYDYNDALALPNDTSSEFGTHLGGGVTFPIIPAIASIDLNGRYVHLREKGTLLSPGSIKQSFITTSLGVAIKF